MNPDNSSSPRPAAFAAPDTNGGGGAGGSASPRSVSVLVDDLLAQPVEVVVSEWYHGLPAWAPAPLPAIARRIKEEAGPEVFRELAEEGALKPGAAVLTGAGRLKQYKGIVHVGVRGVWGGAASEATIRDGAWAALGVVRSLGFRSVAFPVIGAGRGLTERRAYEVLRDALLAAPLPGVEVKIIRSPDRPE